MLLVISFITLIAPAKAATSKKTPSVMAIAAARPTRVRINFARGEGDRREDIPGYRQTCRVAKAHDAAKPPQDALGNQIRYQNNEDQSCVSGKNSY